MPGARAGSPRGKKAATPSTTTTYTTEAGHSPPRGKAGSASRGPQILSYTVAESEYSYGSSADADALSDTNFFVTCGSAVTDDDDGSSYPALEQSRRAKKTLRDWVPKTPLEFLDSVWAHIKKYAPKNVKRKGMPAVIVVGVPETRAKLLAVLDRCLKEWILYCPATCQPYVVVDKPEETRTLQKSKNMAMYLRAACLKKGEPDCSCSKYSSSPPVASATASEDKFRMVGIPETCEDWKLCEQSLSKMMMVSVSPKTAQLRFTKVSKASRDIMGQHLSAKAGGGKPEGSSKGTGDSCSGPVGRFLQKTEDPHQVELNKEAATGEALDSIQEADHENDCTEKTDIITECSKEAPRQEGEDPDQTDAGKERPKRRDFHEEKTYVKETDADQECSETYIAKHSHQADPGSGCSGSTYAQEHSMKTEVDERSAKKEDCLDKEHLMKTEVNEGSAKEGDSPDKEHLMKTEVNEGSAKEGDSPDKEHSIKTEVDEGSAKKYCSDKERSMKAEVDERSAKKYCPDKERSMKAEVDGRSAKERDSTDKERSKDQDGGSSSSSSSRSSSINNGDSSNSMKSCGNNPISSSSSSVGNNNNNSSSSNSSSRFNIKLVQVEPLEEQYLNYSRVKKGAKPKAAPEPAAAGKLGARPGAGAGDEATATATAATAVAAEALTPQPVIPLAEIKCPPNLTALNDQLCKLHGPGADGQGRAAATRGRES